MKAKAHIHLVSAALPLVAAIALAAGWLLDLAARGGQWWTRAAIAVPLVVLAAATSLWHLRTILKHRKAAQRYIDLLCRLDVGALSAEDLANKLPMLADNNPWKPLFTNVRNCILSYNQRLADAEHARSCAEVRAHRATAEVEQLTVILGGLSEPIVAVDNYGELLLSNPSANQLLQIEADNAESRALNQLVACETLVNLLTDTSRRKALSQRTGEVTLTDIEGMQRTYRITCRGIATVGKDREKDKLELRQGAVAVLNDITNEKLIQKRNAEFVSSVSHEMKTPLSSIRAYVELLADGDAEDEKSREEFLGVISGQADRLQRLVENLLNLARIEAGVVEVHKEARSLNELLTEALGIVQPSAEQKSITLVGDLSPLYLGVHVDRDMMLQGAINLLSNAIKYTHNGGKVTLRSRTDDSEIYFEVEDTGVGLSEEDCDKVFEKFYRVKKDKNMAAGTGLGLPLAKHIVEDVHGGRLTLKSELGKGSVFRITLPSAGRMKEK